jgi:choline dehydrogenase
MTSLLTGNVLFVRLREGRAHAAPDLQLNFTPSLPQPLANILTFEDPVMIFLPILVQPESGGEVKLRSSNPLDLPLVNPGYLERPSDLDVLASAVQLIRELTRTAAFRDWNGGEILPGDGTDLESFIRGQASTLWHPVGTCQMGRGRQAVVDPQLRVYGVEGLRIADASVMPRIPSGNTQAACFMIGEKLADMIVTAL